MVIYQERIHNISETTVTAEELETWERDKLIPAAKNALSENPEAASGWWCRYCVGRATCRKRCEDALDAAGDMKKPELLTDAEIEQLLPKLDNLIAYAESVKEYALKKAVEQGRKWQGFKLVESVTKRKILDEAEVGRVLLNAGYDPYQKKLMSISEIQKLVGKAQFEELVEGFGYGKGYTYIQEEFGEFLKLLTKVTEVGINVVITAHGKPRKFELPDEQGAFDRYETKLTRQVAPLIKEWCDMLLFCNYKTFVVTTENNSKKAQGGKRVMYTTHNPCWDAKNRFNLPDELDLDFASIAHLFEDVTPADKKPKKTDKPKAAQDLIAKVKKLVEDNGITEGQLESVVTAKGHYPDGTILEEYSADFITRWIIPNFKKIVETIKEHGGND